MLILILVFLSLVHEYAYFYEYIWKSVYFFGYVGHVTIFIPMLTIACCLVVGLWLWLCLDSVSRWFVAIHTYFYYVPLSLPLSPWSVDE